MKLKTAVFARSHFDFRRYLQINDLDPSHYHYISSYDALMGVLYRDVLFLDGWRFNVSYDGATETMLRSYVRLSSDFNTAPNRALFKDFKIEVSRGFNPDLSFLEAEPVLLKDIVDNWGYPSCRDLPVTDIRRKAVLTLKVSQQITVPMQAVLTIHANPYSKYAEAITHHLELSDEPRIQMKATSLPEDEIDSISENFAIASLRKFVDDAFCRHGYEGSVTDELLGD